MICSSKAQWEGKKKQERAREAKNEEGRMEEKTFLTAQIGNMALSFCLSYQGLQKHAQFS